MESESSPPKYSVCIITNGLRGGHLRALIRSARRQRRSGLEIIVAGRPSRAPRGVTRVDCHAAADAGRPGEMRNKAMARSSGRLVVMVDDDLRFLSGFFDVIDALPERFGAASCRILNPDGSRFWDWSTKGGPLGHRLKPYDEPADRYTYLTGGLCILERWVADRARWDARLGFYEDEDVVFSSRLATLGIRPVLCRDAVVMHDDPRYKQKGAFVIRLEKRSLKKRFRTALRRQRILAAHRLGVR